MTVNSPDNAKVLTSYDLLTGGPLLGSVMTVTDQAGKQRRSVTDSLGRLARVDEPTAAGLGLPTAPNQPTHYTYDIQGNLRKVDQGGQLRYFAYDSLNRLLRAKNPEQSDNAALSLTDAVTGHNGWSMGYAYDAAGNLLERRDARNLLTKYDYDNFNRVTRTRYFLNGNENTPDPATPEVKRYYDGFYNGDQNQPYSKGALWRTETANTSQVTVSNFDSISRPRTLTQAFYGNGGFNAYRYEVKREYDLTGAVTKQTYPSGHEVKYNFDAVKRLGDVPDANPQQPDLTRRAFNGNLGDGVRRSYADTPRYDERGLMSSERYGMVTPLHHRMSYNVRGQMTDMQLGSGAGADAYNRGRIQNYYAGAANNPAASGANNNGNLLAQDNFIPNYTGATGPTTFRQTYGYDELNRLTGVTEYYNGGPAAQWQQSYNYDRWGNRLINQANIHPGDVNIPKPNFTCDTTNNRLLPGAGMAGAMTYDAAGNLTNDTATGNGGRVFDAENRMTQAQGTGNLAQHYGYDGDGRRISRTVNNVVTWQVYGFEGELLSEYAANSLKILPQKEYGYVGGKLLITANGGDDNRLRRFVENLYYRTWGYLPAGKGQTQINAIVAALGTNGQADTAAMLQAAKDLAAGLFDSSQYANVSRPHEQYVADLYLAYLQRAPEPGAIAWYAGFLNSNQLTRLQLRNEFANGPEFAWIVNALWGAQAGDYDRVDRLINQIYTAATGAPPTTAQRDGERGRFDLAEAKGLNEVKEAAKALGRDLLGANTGYRMDLSATEYVTRLYQTFLRRAPDANFSNYVTQADAPNGRNTVLEAFLSMSAYTERSGALYREIYWLISDHLGTPRLIAERTGKLEGIKRSDYLPFGEVITAGVGGRSAAQGYVDDSVRQGFTGYERDDETGLDYAIARYYSNTQGRFTSSDPLMASAYIGNPQSWNRYSYALNNPLKLVDPNGI